MKTSENLVANVGVEKPEYNVVRNIENLNLKKRLIKNEIAIYNNQRLYLSNRILTPIPIHQQKKLKRKQYKLKKLNNDVIVQLIIYKFNPLFVSQD